MRNDISEFVLKGEKDLFEKMNFDSIFELKYFSMLFSEGLRLAPVAPSSSVFEVTKNNTFIPLITVL